MTTSTKKSYPLYSEQLETILAVTRMLNKNGEDINFGDMYRLKVQLVENAGDSVIGEWSDEIAVTDWEFAIVQEKEKKTPVTWNPGIRGAVDATQTQIQPEEMLRTNGVIQPEVVAQVQPANRPRRVEETK